VFVSIILGSCDEPGGFVIGGDGYLMAASDEPIYPVAILKL
jgi:hypothetical protein